MRAPTTDRLATQKTTRTDRVALLALALGFVLIALCVEFQVVDDAFITFRYAKNLVTSGELVMNPGERVEGITNLMWALVVAVELLLSTVPVQTLATWTSLGLLAFTSFRLWQLAPMLGAPAWVGAIAAGALLLSPEFLLAVTNGLEGALYSAFLIEMVFRFTRSQYTGAFVAAGLVFTTRPEGAAVAVWLLLLASIEQRSLAVFWRGSAITLGFLTGTTIFRLYYYGSPIPNSVIAKSLDLGQIIALLPASAGYVCGFCSTNPHLVALLLVTVLGLGIRTRAFRFEKPEWVGALCVGPVLLSFAIVVRNGGDWMGHHRLLVQYGALYAALLPAVVVRLPISPLLASAFLLVPLVQMTSLVPTLRAIDPTRISIVPPARNWFWADAARRLAPRLGPDDVVSAEAMGFISYQLGNTAFHDPVGLTDAYLARNGRPSPTFGRHDSQYTLGRVRPAVLLWHWAGHLQGVEPEILAHYRTWCREDCDSWSANIAMVRRDRAGDLASAFEDWTPVKIDSNGVHPLR